MLSSSGGTGDFLCPIDYIGITPADEADISVLKETAGDLYDTPVYTDEAYISETLAFMLTEQNSPLNTPVKYGDSLFMSTENWPPQC
ncbi:MAG: hypothetical protein ACL93V_01680 [Candidatus Electrothrix sp. YB6]